jgi:WD40 repeat protein
VRFRHPSWGVFRLAVTPDGKTIVTAGEEHDVCLWEMDTGRLIRRFHTGDLYPRGFALAPGGQLVALGGFRIIDNARPSVGSIQMRNTVTGKVVREIVIKDDRMDSLGLAFSPDGKLLASLNGNGVARLTEVATGIELLREQFPRDYAGPIRFSPDGTSLAVASGPNARKVFLWEWEKGKPPREIPVRPRGARSLDFSPDGKTLATGDDGNEGIRLWDVASGRMLRQFANTHDWDTIRVCWSPDGHYLASSGYHERALVLWDPRTGKEVRRLSGRRGVFGWIVFTPDSRRLVATSGDGVIHIFDVATGKELSAGRAGHHQAPSFVELRRDGTAVTAGDDGSVRFWDARTGTQRRAISVGPEWVRAAALSLDGRWLATSELGRKHAVRLWDARTGKQVYRLLGHGRLGGVRAVAFTADGKQFLSWGDDLYLRRWDIRNGKAVDERRAIPPGVTPTNEDDDERGTKFYMVSAGVFSRDGTLLAVQGIKTLAVLDARTGKEKIQMPWDGGHLMGLAISSDNKYLAASAWGAYKEVKLPDGRVRTVSEGHFVSLFEIATGKQLHRIVVVKDRERIGPPAFSADGKRFAVGVGDVPARILLFDTASGKPAGTIANVPAAVQSLAFSPDGKRLIAGLKDTTAVIWDLEKTLKER